MPDAGRKEIYNVKRKEEHDVKWAEKWDKFEEKSDEKRNVKSKRKEPECKRTLFWEQF